MGLLKRDAESAWLDLPPATDAEAMAQLIGSSVTHRIALGPQAGRKALVLRTITPLVGEDAASERVAKAHGFSCATSVCRTPAGQPAAVQIALPVRTVEGRPPRTLAS